MNALLSRALLLGLYGGIAGIHVSLVGLVGALQGRAAIADLISLGSALPFLVAGVVGWRAGAASRTKQLFPITAQALGYGALAGAVSGALVALLALLIQTVDISWVLINARAPLADTLQFQQGAGVGSLILVAGSTLLGLGGAALNVLPPRIARAVAIGFVVTLLVGLMEPFVVPVLDNLSLAAIEEFLYQGGGLTLPGFIVVFALIAGGTYLWSTRGDRVRTRYRALPSNRQQMAKIAAFIVLAILLLLLPQIVGRRVSEILGTIGLYVLLGLGLNIVVGFAGLLDLGYVAFYAVGAYATALLTSPASPAFNPELPFWGALPLVILIAAVIGLFVGAPVLRLRGDYLAIVTLGFGEIAREIVKSQWAQPVTGGAQGILSIPSALPFERDPQSIYYPILFFCILAGIAASSLAASRVGRAWNAMREDESVAEATGVDTTYYKLLAFGLGAAFGCLSGAFFAAKIGVIYADSFSILVSINALALIILGGMGNIWGVVVGALVLVGLPEFLREFSEYRLLIYGAVLVAMMLLRPEGLLPSRTRQAELHHDEDEEDQYARGESADMPRPAVTS
jgi:branched-chain amino acid transport system permease protein